jgi:hypothetical protein
VKGSSENEKGIVYEMKCKDCGQKYIQEARRKPSIRLKEHLVKNKRKRDTRQKLKNMKSKAMRAVRKEDWKLR